ncbi:hypothetical protein CK203_101988 [Vitis vinifera]|uniref:Uncharacterized protein n=1 Tax=Vitis vinifera TaxID=29760 RepID=A0A438D8Q0_VITVI|nr:hypothetical protein CK203_101988 [Vitis vinifera]
MLPTLVVLGIVPRMDNNLELNFGLQEHAMSLGPKRSDTHRAALTGDIGDPIHNTSRQK